MLTSETDEGITMKLELCKLLQRLKAKSRRHDNVCGLQAWVDIGKVVQSVFLK